LVRILHCHGRLPSLLHKTAIYKDTFRISKCVTRQRRLRRSHYNGLANSRFHTLLFGITGYVRMSCFIVGQRAPVREQLCNYCATTKQRQPRENRAPDIQEGLHLGRTLTYFGDSPTEIASDVAEHRWFSDQTFESSNTIEVLKTKKIKENLKLGGRPERNHFPLQSRIIPTLAGSTTCSG